MPVVHEFKERLLSSFGDRLTSVVLTGSHARGDARSDSDVDLWIFLDRIDAEDLIILARILGKIPTRPKINPQYTTFQEVQESSFRHEFDPMQLHFDGVIVHGRLDLPKPSPEAVLLAARTIASAVVMSCRHYLTTDESGEALEIWKIHRWVLKPLMWSLRYEMFYRTGRFPRTLNDLALSTENTAASSLVRIYEVHLEDGHTSDPFKVLQMAYGTAQNIAANDLRA